MRVPRLKDGEKKTHRGDASQEKAFCASLSVLSVPGESVCSLLHFLGQIIIEAKLQAPGFSEAWSGLGGRDTNGI